MATERMYELAFQYKGIKLWQQLYDDELFAVRLSDGAIGYCCVMGMIGEHNALALYVGEEGYQSYCAIRNADQDRMTDQTMGELLTSQSCLQCSFENKDMLSKEVEEMFDVLMQMPDSELRQMPQELVNMLYSLSEAGALPDALDSRIRKLFRKKN